jgi:hypothetical protein
MRSIRVDGMLVAIVPRVHCRRDRVAIDPAVLRLGRAAHDRRLFQKMADGMGDLFRLADEPVAAAIRYRRHRPMMGEGSEF